MAVPKVSVSSLSELDLGVRARPAVDVTLLGALASMEWFYAHDAFNCGNFYSK
jgi:hypothetical protein